MVEFIGYAAASISALIFLPQVFKTVKTKNTKDLSLSSFVLITLNNSLWFTYGMLTSDIAIILSQLFLLPMGLIILIFKLKYG